MQRGSTMTQGGKAGVYAAAAALRLALFVLFPSLPDLFTGRVEISTPVTSFKRCRYHFLWSCWSHADFHFSARRTVSL